MIEKNRQIVLLTALFFIAGALDMLALIFKALPLRFITKPAIVLLLAVLYLAVSKKRNKIYLLALLFTIMADVLLLCKGRIYFLFGLIALAITHLSYIILLKQDLKKIEIKKLIVAILPFFMTVATVIMVIQGNLSYLLLPVVVFGFIITILGGLSFYNYLIKKDTGSLFMLLGVFLFVSSAGIVAIERFALPHRELELGLVIMFTYIISQFLIYQYMIRRTATI